MDKVAKAKKKFLLPVFVFIKTTVSERLLLKAKMHQIFFMNFCMKFLTKKELAKCYF